MWFGCQIEWRNFERTWIESSQKFGSSVLVRHEWWQRIKWSGLHREFDQENHERAGTKYCINVKVRNEHVKRAKELVREVEEKSSWTLKSREEVQELGDSEAGFHGGVRETGRGAGKVTINLHCKIQKLGLLIKRTRTIQQDWVREVETGKEDDVKDPNWVPEPADWELQSLRRAGRGAVITIRRAHIYSQQEQRCTIEREQQVVEPPGAWESGRGLGTGGRIGRGGVRWGTWGWGRWWG